MTTVWTGRLLIDKPLTILACSVVLWALGVVVVPLAAAESTDRQTPAILAGTA